MWASLRSLRIFSAYAERRYARQASGELLDLFRSVLREFPELSGRKLYRVVIARRLGSDDGKAAEIVLRAEESFTDWPVERELRFRHVVHYQVALVSLTGALGTERGFPLPSPLDERRRRPALHPLKDSPIYLHSLGHLFGR